MGNSQTKNQIKGRNKKQVHWRAAEHPGPPGKPELVANIDATPDVVTIKWDKPKSDGGTPISGYLIEHRRTGSPHWVRATPLLITIPELTLSGLEPGWRYQFRVSAQNIVGMSEPGEVSEPLTVTLQRSIITAPKFTEELKDCSALENEMAEFIVHVIGQPPPKICWFKDGFEIFSSRRTRIITENGKSVLTIHQVALSDEGEIKCTATNRAGHASTKGIVKIEAPPKIRLPRQYEDGLLFELDEVIRLKVSIAGRPQPLIFWSHNGESIQGDERYEITDTDKASTLRVGQAKRSDRGEYLIRAVNKIGEDSTSFLVTVTDRPKPPQNVKVVMALGRSVTLSWSEPEDDGGCKIGAYIVEYFRVGWNVWLKASTCRHMTTMLNDLIEGSEYKFRVKAESPYGVSDPSDETGVIFIPDPKRGMMSPPARSRSQPRDVIKDDLPVPPKRRSASSTRNQGRETTSNIIIPDTVPVRPKRDKIKSPPKSPDQSPRPTRKDTGINTNFFDRASLAREISYGIDMKIKKPELKLELNKLEVKDEHRSPRPRNKSPSRLNNLISSILPKKSPSPSKKSPSPSKKTPSPKKSPTPNDKIKRDTSPANEKDKSPHMDIPMTVEMLEVRSERSDLYDRSPSPIERRLSLKMNGSPNKHSPDKGSPNLPRKLQKDKSPSPSRISVHSNNGSRRGSVRSNRLAGMDNEEQGSQEFMLVLFPEHGDKYYQDHDPESSVVYFDLEEELIPPPMSLSAPELGAEPPVFEFMRTAVSSTELLYERSLTRFRKAAEEAEEAELARRASTRKASNVEEKIKVLEEDSGERRLSIPKILINSTDQEDLASKNAKRRLSGGVTNATQQYMWAKRRRSLRNQAEVPELPEPDIPKTNLDRQKGTFSLEKTAEEEDKIMEEVLPEKDVTEKRKEMLSRQRSASEEQEEEEFAKVRARMEQEKKEIKNGSKDIYVMKEDKWEEESEESDELSDEDDERLRYDTMPPLIQAQEQETYHPRAMNMTTAVKQPSDEPFEILTKPSPLPDPNFVPKPILKKPEEKKQAPEKPIRKNLGNEPTTSLSLTPPDVSPSRSRSRTPSPSPGRTIHRLTPIRTTAAESQIQQQAAEAARNKRNLQRTNSDEETTVVIDYYGSIVRQYGSLKRTQQLYLDRDEIKAAAEPQETKQEPGLSALEILAKYAQNVDDKEDAYKDILSHYHEPDVHQDNLGFNYLDPHANQNPEAKYHEPDVHHDNLTLEEFQDPRHHQERIAHFEQPNRHPESSRSQESALSKRQPSPSPFMRKPLLNDTSKLPQPPAVSKRQPSPVASRRPMEVSTPEARQRKTSRTRSSSRTRQNQRASTPSDIKTKLEMIEKTRTPSPRPMTPEQEALQIEAEINVRSSLEYLTDLTMFIVACWLYFFKDPLLAIPVLLITVYRQLQDEVSKCIPSWMMPKKQ